MATSDTSSEDVARYNLRVTAPNVGRALDELHAIVTTARSRDRRPMAYEARMMLSAAADLLAAVVTVETLEGVLPSPETHT